MSVTQKVAAKEQAVLAAEDRRCAALLANDVEALKTLLSPAITHTHTNGKTEDYSLYLSLLAGPMRYLNISRRDITVRIYGSTAVMDGIADMKGQIGDSEPLSMAVRMLQVWVEGDAGWQMVAFQGTRIPD